MSEGNDTSDTTRDAANWARKSDGLRVGALPAEAINLNVDGRQVAGPLQGFGQLWQKTYRVALVDSASSPEEVIATWKARFPDFQPASNRFFPSVAGVAPGEVVLINAALQGMPIQTGVLVLYADQTSFTLMTPEGHPESGWVTFSAWRAGETTIAQVQSLARASDPIYEIGFTLGGSAAQEAIWRHVLVSLAEAHGVFDQAIAFEKQRVDQRLQWRHSRNIWHNAALRSLLYALARPFRDRA
jgi:hypothetical protein